MFTSTTSSLLAVGISELNEMQKATAKAFKSYNDIVLLSPTGSGKTLAFLLPIIEILTNDKVIQGVIIVPSRELALQIESVFKQLQTGFKVSCCYGGHAIKTEINNLSEAPALLIGTPGRIDDLLKRNVLDLSQTNTIVLDEFDKSLELGFQEEMTYIIKKLKLLKKRVLTSATSLNSIPDFVGVQSPHYLSFLSSSETNSHFELKKIVLAEEVPDKLQPLLLLLSQLGQQSTLVFFNHREAVNRASEFLSQKNVVHAVFHGELKQDEREKTLAKFRNGSTNIVLATDLAARGLDIPEIKAVVHYHLPTTLDAFTHRNGRTARMHASGTAYLLIPKGAKVPQFIPTDILEEKLPATALKIENPTWETLYIGKGKKDKLSKGDIAGFLFQKGKLEKSELGIIEVKDFHAFAAIKRDKIKTLVTLIDNQKIKNQKPKFEIAR